MFYFYAFIAGFVSTLVFHQGVLALMHAANPSVPAAFNMATTQPLGIPAVISLAFWGGLWGILLWFLIRDSSGAMYWVKAIAIGAVAPSLVAWFVAMPLKGMGIAGGWDPKIIIGALILNAAWGLGVALLMLLPGKLAAAS